MVVLPKRLKMIILVAKPMVVGYHHFRVHPHVNFQVSMKGPLSTTVYCTRWTPSSDFYVLITPLSRRFSPQSPIYKAIYRGYSPIYNW